MLRFILSPQKLPMSPLGRLISLILGVVVLVTTMMLSLVFFSVFLCVLLVFWGYFWFKTRKVREMAKKAREMRFQAEREAVFPTADEGVVIEGESVRVAPDRADD